MAKIRKYNKETGKWEIYSITDAAGLHIADFSDNFDSDNVEGALRELANKQNINEANIKAQSNMLNEHQGAIDWLLINGGGGGGGSAPTITSTFQDGTIVEKGQDVIIPIFFNSPNQGTGIAYISIDGVEVTSIEGIKQGNNNINIGKLPNLHNNVGIYVKDRMDMLSNQLNWNIICGGLEVELNFDYSADYEVTDIITMAFNVQSASTDPIKMHLTIDYDEYEIDCVNGYNEYTFSNLAVGVHKVEFYLTSGAYKSTTFTFNVVVVSSTELYISSTFEGGEFTFGNPVQIDYRISKKGLEEFNITLSLNGTVEKTLVAPSGSYYWTLNNLPIGEYIFSILVEGASGDSQMIEGAFVVVQGAYTPLSIIETGLTYRLSALGRTNNDSDKTNPIDDSGNGVITTLHDFNYYTNGWIDDVLVCNGNAYVEIDCTPWQLNAPYGSTIEIQFKGLDIGFIGSRIFDYTDSETPYRGAYIDLEETTMKSLANSGTISIDRDEWITLSFVIDRTNKFGKIYVDGVCSRAFALSDTGSGVGAIREDFSHTQKIYLNSKKGKENFGACEIKEVRVYSRTLNEDEILQNYIAQERDLYIQEELYKSNYQNTTLPIIRMYGDTTNMTAETPVQMRIKYTSTNEDKYGQSFDLPYCDVCWQGTSSLQYVLKNFTAYLKDESMADYYYTPYPNGISENVYCFKCDYMESSHSRNVGIAKFVNECLYDTKNPAQLKDERVRNAVNGFPCLMYINDELQGVYNFNLDRYSTISYGYEGDSCITYEITANADMNAGAAGAFYKWSSESGKSELDYYKSDFECIYPPTRRAGNDNMEELIRLIEWVHDSSDEDFRDNIGNYFNLEYLLRYFLFVYVFGAVDSLGKNMKLATWDGRIWYPQVYDADTSIGLDNTGSLKFDMDIEMGDEDVFNSTSQLWKKVQLLFQPQLEEQYTLMRQKAFTVDNMMKYLVEEQIDKIPIYYYNKDMQTKYLNYGSSYLNALHGNGKHHIRKWLKERLMYCDTLFGYNVSSSDYITVRSSKLGEVYFDIETYIPMYVTIKWRNEAGGTGTQTKRVGRGETVRFSYNAQTATDQEVLIYAGYYLKRLGNLSNLEPTYLILSSASRLTEIECHSPNLISADLSQCTLLQRIDLSNSTALGTGAQSVLDIQNCKYLRYCNCYNTRLTAIYTIQRGGCLEEIYYPSSIQLIQLTNQTYLHTMGIPYDMADSTTPQNLANVEVTNCNNVTKLCYPYNENITNQFSCLKYVQNLILNNSLDYLTAMNFDGFSKLKSITLQSLENLASIKFNNLLLTDADPKLSNVVISNCPLIDKISFNVTNDNYKIEFTEGCIIDLAGLSTVKVIESNTSIKGLDTLIIPISTKELRFTTEYGDGLNEIRRILSANSTKIADSSFEGMDLINVQLTFLDMSALTISNAINFHIAPISQHPNLNTLRDGVTVPYFRPQGSLDLTKYVGEIKGMFKGLDLDNFAILPPSNTFAEVKDLSNLFEGTILSDLTIVNRILAQYPYADNYSYMFKNSSLTDASKLMLPTHKFSMKGMFMESALKEDIDLPLNVSNVEDCFRNCRELTSIRSQWNKSFIYNDMIHTNCYLDCININRIDNRVARLRDVPFEWGGHGFITSNIGSYTVEILEDNYNLVMGDLINNGAIEWGDDTYSYNEKSHTFVNKGIYTIQGEVCPNEEGLSPSGTLSQVLVSVNGIPSVITNLENMFLNCKLLRLINLDNVDFSVIQNTNAMFKNCIALTMPPIIDFTNITTANEMYRGCIGLTSLSFNNLCANTFSCTNIVDGCVNLTELEFIGNLRKSYAQAIIDIINTYILENTISVNELVNNVEICNNNLTMINNGLNTINEQQAIQNEGITNIMFAIALMYENIATNTTPSVNIMSTNGVKTEDTQKNISLDKTMVQVYYYLVSKGLITINEVPNSLKIEVTKLLQ